MTEYEVRVQVYRVDGDQSTELYREWMRHSPDPLDWRWSPRDDIVASFNRIGANAAQVIDDAEAAASREAGRG